MAVNFPDSPTVGDLFTSNSKTWEWTGTGWRAYGAVPNISVFRVDEANQRVGVNNTTPAVALDVTGATKVSGDLTVDTNTLFVDSANNRVGIGTTAPVYKLDVAGSIGAGGSLTVGSNGEYVAGSIYSDSNWGMILRAKQASPAQAEFRFANSADVERMRITSSGIVTKPYTPAFRVYCAYTDSHSAISGVETVPFAGIQLNNGNHFLTSGTNAYKRFVAPVSGLYWVSVGFGIISATTDYYYGMTFFVNDAAIGVSYQYYKHSGGGNDDSTSQSILLYLNESDYVTVRTNFQDSKRIQWAVFSGFLIG